MSALDYFYCKDISKVDGIFSLIIFNFCLVSPILHYKEDYWYSLFFDDRYGHNWVSSTELWIVISTIIILSYYFIKNSLNKIIPLEFNLSRRMINKKKLIFYSILFLLVSGLFQSYIYISLGGVSGYISAYTLRAEGGHEFAGLGKFMLIAEVFPVILIIFFMSLQIEKGNIQKGTSLKILILLILFFILLLFFGGLKGSRSNTLLAVFWFLSILHVYYKKITIKSFLAIGFIFISYMMIYGLYKNVGNDFVSKLSIENVQSNPKYKGNALVGVLTGDLSRYEVQTEIINEIINHNKNVWLGESYFDAILTPLPSGFQNYIGVRSKTELATELFFGEINLATSQAKSTFISGLVGESISNFHLVGVFISIFILISCNYILQSIKSGLTLQDPRYFIVFFFPIIFVNIYTGDIQNVIFYIIKNLTFPVIYCYLISDKVKNET